MEHRKIRFDHQTLRRMTGQIELALGTGQLSHGPFIEKVEEEMREIADQGYAVAVSSGTMALKIVLRALGIGKDDFVLVPALTFVGCASVVLELGATPIFVDTDANGIMDEEIVQRCVESDNYGSIKAIINVALGGELVPFSEKLGVPVIYDCAHRVGKIPKGGIGCFSFHPSKIISGAEGGCITTDDENLASYSKKLRLFGFEPGERTVSSDKLGYKANLPNLSAIVIFHNLLNRAKNLDRRKAIRDRMNEEFGLKRVGLGMYMIPVKDPERALEAIPGALRHYPATLPAMFGWVGSFPVAEELAAHLISLPFHENLKDEEVKTIIELAKPELWKK